MKNKLLTEQFVNPFFIQGEKVLLDNIIVFNNGNVITEFNKGWFDAPHQNMFKEIDLKTDIKKRRKINLNNKEIFFVKPNILYINQDFLKNFKIEENVKIEENDLGIVYGNRISFEVFGTFRKYINENGKAVLNYITDWKNINLTKYIKTEQTEKGKYINKLIEKAKEKNIDISFFKMNQLIEIFDIKIKEL